MSSAAVLEAERLESIAAGARRLVYDGAVGPFPTSDNATVSVMPIYVFRANAGTHALN
jgi:hypothetical protein